MTNSFNSTYGIYFDVSVGLIGCAFTRNEFFTSVKFLKKCCDLDFTGYQIVKKIHRNKHCDNYAAKQRDL